MFSNTVDDVDTEHGPELSSQRALLDSAASGYWYGEDVSRHEGLEWDGNRFWREDGKKRWHSFKNKS